MKNKQDFDNACRYRLKSVDTVNLRTGDKIVNLGKPLGYLYFWLSIQLLVWPDAIYVILLGPIHGQPYQLGICVSIIQYPMFSWATWYVIYISFLLLMVLKCHLWDRMLSSGVSLLFCTALIRACFSFTLFRIFIFVFNSIYSASQHI